MMNITMPRGDLRRVKFAIKDSQGSAVDIAFTQIYMTVKRSFSDGNFLFQKKLSDQTITQDSDGYYFTIQPEDTDGLPYGTYVFDIELIYEDIIKQTIVGSLTITNEVTFARNES